MKILYDHQAFTIQQFGGVSKCFCELVNYLPMGASPTISLHCSNNIHIQSLGLLNDLKKPTITYDNFICESHFIGKGFLYQLLNRYVPFFPSMENLNKRKSISLLKEGDFDIFHPTFFDDYFLDYIGDKPFVITIHDMMPELFSKYFADDDIQIVNKKKLADKAAAIIAVSEQTKNDIVRLLDINPDKIHVVYHGGPKKRYLKNDLCCKGDYFLYVGLRNAYKNFFPMLEEFAKFSNHNTSIKLICTGPSFTSEENAFIEDLGLSSVISHVHPSDDQLYDLYKRAIAFIYPSEYEGFGMPILEAYSCGCPVLLNNSSCFPEIAGDAAKYFELSNSKRTLSDVLQSFVNISEKDLEALIQKQYERLTLFSWEKSANKLVDVYKKVLNDIK